MKRSDGDELTSQRKKELFNAIEDYFLRKYQGTWDACITLAINRPGGANSKRDEHSRVPIYEGESVVKQFHAKLDRKILGKHYSKRTPSERTHLLLLPAYGKDAMNLHYHGIIRYSSALNIRHNSDADGRTLLTAGKDSFTVESYIQNLWRNVSKGGSCDIQRPTDINGWIRYGCLEIDDSGRLCWGDIWTDFIDSMAFISTGDKSVPA